MQLISKIQERGNYDGQRSESAQQLGEAVAVWPNLTYPTEIKRETFHSLFVEASRRTYLIMGLLFGPGLLLLAPPLQAQTFVFPEK